MASKTLYAVYIDGDNITSSLDPILINLKVTDKEGSASDACSIDLDDTDQQIQFPKEGADMRVLLGWGTSGLVEVFVGKVDHVQATGARGQGRTLKIEAKGLDTKGKAKQRKHKHIDKKKISEAIKDAGQDAGITDVTVDPDLDEERDYFALQNEGVWDFADRLANEVGGVAHFRNNRIVIAKRGAGKAPGGQTLPTVTATWGDNLISYDVIPVTGITRYKKVKARYFDRKKAAWQEIEADTEDTDAEATHQRAHPADDEKHAKQHNRNSQAAASDSKGGGSVILDGNPTARAEGTVVIVGARPGVDGQYAIEGVDHSVSKAGFTTTITLKRPGEGTGKDSRPVKKTK